MIKAVEYRNFKRLRQTTLPLGPFTLLVGANGSGRSTALQGLRALGADAPPIRYETTVSIGSADAKGVSVAVHWGGRWEGGCSTSTWSPGTRARGHQPPAQLGQGASTQLDRWLGGIRLFAFEPRAMAIPSQLNPRMELDESGVGLAGVLDRLRDEAPERFDGLNEELRGWLPEFDRVLFKTPTTGVRALSLRLSSGRGEIPAQDLSQGTVLSLGFLTLGYLQTPPTLVCVEEPDRGMHPRLLEDVRDALYRLSYPGEFGDNREAVQVVATTHSPYFLKLFKDRRDEVVIAEMEEHETKFRRLSDLPNVNEILEGADLGEAWFTGILGGVPRRG